MGIADRVRDATRPTNEIVQVFDPARATGQTLHSAKTDDTPATAARPVQGSERAAPGDKKAPAYTSEPESIAKAYFIEDKGNERRYFDDYKRQGLAMRATETTISTKREDLNTVRNMMDIAAARGWQSVDVKGTAEFKREAWIEAQTRGIEALGYRPSDPDRQEADRRRNERGLSNEVRAPLPSTPATPAAPVTPNNPNASTTDPALKTATARAGTGTPEKTGDKPAQAAEKGTDKAAPAKDGQTAPTLADNRRTLREAQKELSPDGRLVLAAMGEKIDRQMNRHNTEAKAEMKAFVAGELVKKERAEGPVVLSAEQKRTAEAPEPARSEPAKAAAEPTRRIEPEPSRRLSR